MSHHFRKPSFSAGTAPHRCHKKTEIYYRRSRSKKKSVVVKMLIEGRE